MILLSLFRSKDAYDLLNKVDFGDKLAEHMNYEEKSKFTWGVVSKLFIISFKHLA